MEKWTKSVAIVTGANSGNGFSISRNLAEFGVTVVGFDINIDVIDKFISEHGKLKLHYRKCDITNEKETEAAFNWVVKTFGGVDILINNAGLMKNIGVLEHTKPMSELVLNIDLNFTAVVRCSRLAFKSMEARDTYGYIVNINSTAGHSILPSTEGLQHGVYPGTKYAITATSEVMRQELVRMKSRKVRVTSLSPGSIGDTNFAKAAGLVISADMIRAAADKFYLKADDIGDTVVYLLSTPYHINVSEITIRPTAGN